MARRLHDSRNILRDLIDIAARVPWWAGLCAALSAWLALHALAGVPVAPARNPAALGSQMAWQIATAFAGIFQYLIPIPLLMGAAVSAWRQHRAPAAPPAAHERRTEPEDRGFPAHPIPEGGNPPARTRHAITPSQTREIPFSAGEPTLIDTGPGAGPRADPDPDTWTLDLLRALEWKRFEEVCADLCRHLGFEARTQRQGADGGVDIHLYRPKAAAPAVVVQCKSWNTWRVGVKPVRELLGVMTAAGVREGIFMTTATFTREALDFGRVNGIDCMDGPALIGAIRSLPEAAQQSMLMAATAGDYLTPTCASCGIKLVRRERKVDREVFWGCSNYPRCHMQMAMREP